MSELKQDFSEENVRLLIIQYINEIKTPNKRENAFTELSRLREKFRDLAPYLWYSSGVIAILLQEIINVYQFLSPNSLIASCTTHVCNVLTLLQCIASHADTRSLLVKANIPIYLYPFLNTVSKSRQSEYLRLTSLGVIGSLVKIDDPAIIHYLLQTEIIPLCLRIMEKSSELAKTIATFVMQKILYDEEGLKYICEKPERFFAVSSVLSLIVKTQIKLPDDRLIKHVARCYLRFADNKRENGIIE